MRAERDIKAANLSRHELHELIRGPIPAPQPSPEAQELLDAMAGAILDVRTMVDTALHGVGVEIDGQNIPVTDLYRKPQTEAEQLFSLDQPSLRALSHILRHKELWPKGFEWAYKDCKSCAMGLAAQLWGILDPTIVPVTPRMADLFAMPISTASCIFGGNDLRATYGSLFYEQVTPEMVADKIDEYLAGIK